MGENSIINTSESSVNECREGTSVTGVRVRDCPNTIARIAANVVDRHCRGRPEEARQGRIEEARIGVGLARREKFCRGRSEILEDSRLKAEAAESGRKNVNSRDYCPISRLFLFSRSLLVGPSAGLSDSANELSRGASSSRGSAIRVSASFIALVGLAMLLRPAVAVPASDGGASTGSSTFADPTLLRDTNATRIASEFVVIDASDAGDDRGVNLGSVAGATRARRGDVLEYASRRSSDRDEEVDELPASLIPHTGESGHETRSPLREPELDTIRRSIVEGLGLKRIPDPSKANVSQAEYRRAHEEYLTRLQHSRDSVDGRQRRLYTFHPAAVPAVAEHTNPRSRRSPANELIDRDVGSPREIGARLLYFPISIPEENYIVDHACLRILLDPRDTLVETTRHVLSLHHSVGSRLVVSQKLLPDFSSPDGGVGEADPRWIELEATELANEWLNRENATELVIELSFESHETGSRLDHREKRPLVLEAALNIFTTSYKVEGYEGGSLIRRRRRANPEHLMSLHKGRRTECRGENKKCCRHEMIVIFKDLKGFEFIVQPKNFDAGYCKGRCPPRYNPAHHHALLQSLIWKEDRRKAPRPCCAPSKLDELEILYFDENDPTKLKISSWKNMKVLECACS